MICHKYQLGRSHQNIDIFERLKFGPISIQQLQRRRLTFIGHCRRSLDRRKDQAQNPITNLLFWEVERSKLKCGEQRSSIYIKILLKETNCTKEELCEAMLNRERWKKEINKKIKQSNINYKRSLK